MSRKLYTFKFDEDFMEHIREKSKKNRLSMTAYIEKVMKKVSGYKEKELV